MESREASRRFLEQFSAQPAFVLHDVDAVPMSAPTDKRERVHLPSFCCDLHENRRLGRRQLSWVMVSRRKQQR